MNTGTFNWSSRCMVLFVDVANIFNRTNLRNTPYGVDRAGRVLGATRVAHADRAFGRIRN